MTIKKYKYFLFALLPALLGGCIGTKHLKENEKLLYNQHIQAPSEIEVDKLRNLYSQKANRKILRLPISPLVGIYYWGAKNYNQDKYIHKLDSVSKKFDRKIAKAKTQKSINNLQFRKQKKVNKITKTIEDGNLRMQWGEKISIYDSSNVELTKKRFHDYLFSKGYFNNTVTYKVVVLGKFVTITYIVTPRQPYYIDSIYYQVKDTTILNLIKNPNAESLIKKGDRYDQDKFTAERERIDLLLKDHGYYDFSRQYIEFKNDTIMLGNRRIISLLIINDPAFRGYHKQFKIDSVTFTTDAGAKEVGKKRSTKIYRDISYKSYKLDYNLKVLSQRVFLTHDDLYSRTNTISTQQQLSKLDAFKFVNINYDTANGKFKANIYTSPLDRYQFSNEAGVNVTQGIPGPFVNANFKKRNVFKGLETFDLTGRYGYEGVASATEKKNLTSTEAGVNASLTFPQFLWPFREKTLFKLGRFNPKSKLSSGYAYTRRPEYTRSITSINFSYNWEKGKRRRYDLTIASLSIINSSVKPYFQKVLDTLKSSTGNNLYRSFQPSFVSSMIFGMTRNVNNYGNKNKNSVFLRWQIESGGTFLNFFNYPIIEKNNLQTYKYLRFNADFRKNIIIDKNTTLAYRINTGVAYSYDKVKALPYEKYFFVGGSNGVRAWRPRRLGQGSLKPKLNDPEQTPKDGYFNYYLEKPGDILLEGSIELRRHIVGFIEGAVFVDAGNTWTFEPLKTLNSNESNPGNSQFDINTFYKQVGIGTGFGFRFDFTFLIIRLDIGMKVYDPARDGSDRFVLDKARFLKPYATKDSNGNYTNFKEPVIYNFGIGYPF